MNTDNLYQLDDADLSGLFAEKVARLKSICIKAIVNPRIEHYTYSAPTKDNPYLRLPIPSFATSADAVLPWLEKLAEDTGTKMGGEPEVFRFFSPAYKEDTWLCQRVWLHHDGSIVEDDVHAPTFARAACIALIRAKRATGGQA